MKLEFNESRLKRGIMLSRIVGGVYVAYIAYLMAWLYAVSSQEITIFNFLLADAADERETYTQISSAVALLLVAWAVAMAHTLNNIIVSLHDEYGKDYFRINTPKIALWGWFIPVIGPMLIVNAITPKDDKDNVLYKNAPKLLLWAGLLSGSLFIRVLLYGRAQLSPTFEEIQYFTYLQSATDLLIVISLFTIASVLRLFEKELPQMYANEGLPKQRLADSILEENSITKTIADIREINLTELYKLKKDGEISQEEYDAEYKRIKSLLK